MRGVGGWGCLIRGVEERKDRRKIISFGVPRDGEKR